MKRAIQKFSPIYSPVYERWVKQHLPRKITLLNGVITPASRILDPVNTNPDHKHINVEEIKRLVGSDDTVVEVGSGYGVCTVWAARKATNGEVLSYEGGGEMHSVAKEAVNLTEQVLHDGLDSRISIQHAVVGSSENVWGNESGADQIRPKELPACDVLITDCEGAELDILKEMELQPSKAIIEAHPKMGSSVADVESELQSRGYNTTVHSKTDSEVDIVTAE